MTRPRIHLTGERGWINDPHGVTWDGSRYHVFHQAVPDSLVHRVDCSWGHATSPDLLRFEHRPVALAPGEGDDGIWTGATVVGDDGEPRILYTSVTHPDLGMGRVRVARPAEPGTWDAWVKGEVVVEAPAEAGLAEFRDPVVVREDGRWRMFVGGTTRDRRAVALSWTSPDLESWAYDGLALERSTHETDPVWMGEGWECPQFLHVAGRDAMITSVWEPHAIHHGGFALGQRRGGRFEAAAWGRLTWGRYYAPSAFPDADGRACVLLWMREVRGEDWASCLSVPHVLDVREDRLVLEPHPVLAAARGERVRAAALPDAAVDVEWRAGPGDRLRLEGGRRTATLHVGEVAISVDEGTGGEALTVPVAGPGPHDVRLLLDGPALELWVDGRVLAAAVDPPRRLAGDGTLAAWPVRPRD